MEIRPKDTRGHANHGWLETHYSFSFARWHDPRYMGVSDLRVINEDWIQPGMGFGTHPHRDMEIITYVISGALAHKDSMGNVETIPAGDVQVMSAGTGVTHSEFNPSQSQPTHLLQIWILPGQHGLTPGYSQRSFADQRGAILVAAPGGAGDALEIHQNTRIWIYRSEDQQRFELDSEGDRIRYLQVISGHWTANGEVLSAGDGARFDAHEAVTLENQGDAELILFELRDQ